MSKPRADGRIAGEEYELLEPFQPDDEPLLPRYEIKPGPNVTSPNQRHELAKRHSAFRRSLSCLCLGLIIAVPSLALAACYFGRTTLERVRSWEQVPEEVKEWLDKVVPGGLGPDHAAFPIDIGYAGPTPTGSEDVPLLRMERKLIDPNRAALLATAPHLSPFTAVAPLVVPTGSSRGFRIIQHWGNLSPYFTVDSHGLPETSSLITKNCELEEVHWLQRHGARYPTLDYGGPAGVAQRLGAASGWKASGDLSFLNTWSYKLGAELLTPFGRGQLYNLGVSARMKYGFLLDKMGGRLPVFRTESQDRMLRSAQNFATGFFGYPADEQYNLEVTIESPGFNNTMAPWTTCKESNSTTWPVLGTKLAQWDAVYLADARMRLQGLMSGYDFTIRDVKDFMEMCAYETVALGYSSFCNLFTQKEWRGFEYRNDLLWWYSASFGYPYAKTQGIGWVQELVSRLTHTRLTEFNTTTNSTFHNDVHFPLNDPLYVDFTHDTMFMLLLPAMNLTTFSESGDLPFDRIPKHRSFISSKICPFATNLQIQVLSCSSTTPSKQVRIILNDAAVPLTGIRGCPEHDDGLCPLETFVSSMQTLIEEVDWMRDCAGVGLDDMEGVDQADMEGVNQADWEGLGQADVDAIVGFR